MSEAKFTKGEWKVSSCGMSVNTDGYKVARAHSGSAIPYTQPTKANAHLIAAAPEMYNLLERLSRLDDEESIGDGNLWDIRELLSKARGE